MTVTKKELKKVDLYSLLTQNGFKLPRNWQNEGGIKQVRILVIRFFIDLYNNNNQAVNFALVLYSDRKWKRLIRRLNKNGYVER